MYLGKKVKRSFGIEGIFIVLWIAWRWECHLRQMGVAAELPSVGGVSQKYFVWSWTLGLKKEID